MMEEKPHILVVDDDRRIRELLQSYLRENGYNVSLAATADEARQKLKGIVFDLIILDIMMPGETGLSLTAYLREANPKLPVLLLSALSDTEDKIRGLTAGSDDYLAKPFEPRELLLRISNLIRRTTAKETPLKSVNFGPFTFSLQRGELRKGGTLVRLSPREKDLLRLFAKRANNPVDRADLAGDGTESSTRGVDVQITRLRQKIETNPSNPIYLQTVRGQGYVLHIDGRS
jgi:two-component system, OmpR family, phosphate regulon response regulator OmpR